jgi:hypothetical protein
MLYNVDGSSSLTASMFMVVQLFDGRINAAATNGVHWGSCSTFVATVSHFLELKSELELLRSEHNTDVTKDEANAF